MNIFSKEIKLALVGVIAIALLVVGINFLKGVNIFSPTNSYFVRFTDIQGLAVSTPVYANGYAVGNVRSIDYDYDRTDNVVVCIELDKSMRVPYGTRAELESELMGGVKFSLVLGPNPTKNLSVGDTISGGMHIGTLNKLEAMLPVVERMLPKLDSIMTNLNRLTSDPALAQTLHNTAEITSNLKETSASLNQMMKKEVPEMMAKFNRTGSHVETLTGKLARVDIDNTMKQVNTTLTNVNSLTSNLTTTTDFLNRQLNSRDNTLGLFLNDRSVYDNLNSTMSHADSLMIDLRMHPKRYVHFSVFGKKAK